MRDTGIEPVTSSVSGKRATAAPIALNVHHIERGGCTEVETGFEPAYTALQAAASPLGHPTGTRSFVDRVSDLDREVDNCERTTGVEPATLTMAR